MNDVAQKDFATGIEVGGLALLGYDTQDSAMTANNLSGAQDFVNRITTDIDAAKTTESAIDGSAHPWHTWDHTSIPTTKAVYEFVTDQVNTNTGLSVTQATSFDYGIDVGEIVNSGTTYTEASAHEIITTADDGGTFNRISQRTWDWLSDLMRIPQADQPSATCLGLQY